MKIRDDFVTNSSSSSYVVAYKDVCDSKLEKKLKAITLDILESEDYSGNTESARILRSMEEMEKYISHLFGSPSYTVEHYLEDYCPDYTKHEIQKLFDNGFAIAVKSVGYYDSVVNSAIDLLDFASENFIIISRE